MHISVPTPDLNQILHVVFNDHLNNLNEFEHFKLSNSVACLSLRTTEMENIGRIRDEQRG